MTTSSIHQSSKQLTEAEKQNILDVIQKIPVMQSNLSINIEELSWGKCTATAPRHQQYDGYFECYHGGLLTMMADTLACYAIMTITGPEQKMATTDMHIRFLAPCKTDLKMEATVIKPGKVLNPVEVKLFDTNNKQVAVAQITYMLLDTIPHK